MMASIALRPLLLGVRESRGVHALGREGLCLFLYDDFGELEEVRAAVDGAPDVRKWRTA